MPNCSAMVLNNKRSLWKETPTCACSASRRERSTAAAALASSTADMSSFSRRCMRTSSASIWLSTCCS
jgi:hypothetical protein